MVRISRILVPVDLSPASQGVLRSAMSLAGAFGASLAVLHVWEAPSFMEPELEGIGSPVTTVAVVARERSAFEQAERELKSLLFTVSNREEPNVRTVVRAGEASKQIIQLAEEQGFDLIVMATHGRTGLSRLARGSIAERVIRRAPCPVLVLPTEQAGNAAA